MLCYKHFLISIVLYFLYHLGIFGGLFFFFFSPAGTTQTFRFEFLEIVQSPEFSISVNKI